MVHTVNGIELKICVNGVVITIVEMFQLAVSSAS